MVDMAYTNGNVVISVKSPRAVGLPFASLLRLAIREGQIVTIVEMAFWCDNERTSLASLTHKVGSPSNSCMCSSPAVRTGLLTLFLLS